MRFYTIVRLTEVGSIVIFKFYTMHVKLEKFNSCRVSGIFAY